MATVWTRLKSWNPGDTLNAADLNGEYNQGVNAFNAAFDVTTGHDHDGANSKVISYTSLTDKPVDKNVYVLPVTGSLAIGTDVCPLHHEAVESGTLTEVRARVKTAPTGDVIRIDINVGGTSIWNSGGSRLSISAGSKTNSTTTISNTGISKGNLITLDIDNVGSSVNGADLIVYLIYTAALV